LTTIAWPGKFVRVFLDVPSVEPSNWYGSLIQGSRDQSGLMYRRNRYYDPASGLFTQEDPIGLAGGLNLYGYAGGDPVNFSDPFGLIPVPLLIWGGIALFEAASTAYDVYQAGKTLSDPNATTGDKAWASGGAIVGGLGLPGPGTLYAKGAAKLTKWGVEGAAPHRKILERLKTPGTHEHLDEVVPTRQEAERLIYLAGGKIQRIERAHGARGHPYPHINYITETGEKATLRVESVGRQFIRNP
jgi:RHS repeat-associated protein